MDWLESNQEKRSFRPCDHLLFQRKPIVGHHEMHLSDLQKLGVLNGLLHDLLVELRHAWQTILEHGEHRNRIDQIEFGQTLALLFGQLECLLPFFDRVLVRRLAFDRREFGSGGDGRTKTV